MSQINIFDEIIVDNFAGGGGECDTDGNCTTQRHRACILRYLHQPAEENE